jgi:hypothetical protein
VTTYLAELYLERLGTRDLDEGAALARAAANEVRAAGTPVRYLRSIFVPSDEICFHLFEAASAEGVQQAISRAGIAVQRIAEAIEIDAVPASKRRHGASDTEGDDT